MGGMKNRERYIWKTTRSRKKENKVLTGSGRRVVAREMANNDHSKICGMPVRGRSKDGGGRVKINK